VARESSHVEAWGSVSVHCQSNYCELELFGFAVAILIGKAKKLLKKSKTCTVVTPKSPSGNHGWMDYQGVKATRGKVILFKRVSKDFKTQEGTSNETLWKVGSMLTHPAWSPKNEECGPGKFHACSRPYFCDQFRSNKGDRYVAVEIATKDLHAWPNGDYPRKVAFRKGTVLHECDRFGNKIETSK
jgi:hypothetical protein